MSELLELSGDVASFLVERSIVGALVFVLVLVIYGLGRRRISSHFASALFLLPLVALCLPLEWALPDAVGWRDPVELAHLTDSSRGESIPSNSGPLPSPALHAAPPPPGVRELSERPEVSLVSEAMEGGVESQTTRGPDQPADGAASKRDVTEVASGWRSLGVASFVAVWSLVLFGLLVALIARHRMASRLLLVKTRPAPEWMQRLCDRLAEPSGASVPLVLSDTATSPLTLGLLRPSILLPSELSKTLSPSKLRWVLGHEMAHVRRRDLLLSLFQRVVTCVFWFHPLVYVTNRLVARHRECACDDAALSGIAPRQRHRCAEALLDVIEAASRISNPPIPAVLCLANDEGFLRSRFMRLMNEERVVLHGLSLRGVIALGLTLVLGLAAARAQTPEVQWKRSSVQAEAQEAGLRGQEAAPIDDVRAAVQRGTAWLRGQQRDDGSFAVGFKGTSQHPTEIDDTGATALALMALAEAERVVPSPEQRSSLLRATKALLALQGEDGCIAIKKGNHIFLYGHGLATRALSESYRVVKDDAVAGALAKAANYILTTQNPYRGWRYMPRSGDNDAKVTSTMILALQGAMNAGATFSRETFDMAFSYLDDMTDKETGRTGFVQRGSVMSRMIGKRDDFPGKHSEEPTALSLLANLGAGKSPIQSEVLRDGISLLLKTTPAFSVARGSVDYLYWAEGTRVFGLLGGYQRDFWNGCLTEALLGHEERLEGGVSRWPAQDAWSYPGMEVYATSLVVSALANTLPK